MQTVAQLSGDRGVELPDVDLRLRVSVVGPRNTDLDMDQVGLDAAAGHIPGHGHLRQHCAVFGHQPLPLPLGGMPLRVTHVLVRDQPGLNTDSRPWVDRRRDLAR